MADQFSSINYPKNNPLSITGYTGNTNVPKLSLSSDTGIFDSAQTPQISSFDMGGFDPNTAGYSAGGGIWGEGAPKLTPDQYKLNMGDGSPDAEGGWTEGAALGLGVGKLALGAFSAYEQSKMNKFMRGYYGDQMDLQSADFANQARSTNEALERRRERQLSAQGTAAGSAASQAQLGSYMDTHGVDETF